MKRSKNRFGKVRSILRGKLDAAHFGGLIDHVQHQSEKAIDEILPRRRISVKAILQQ